MADISTTYLGLKLNSPIIVGSSGLTEKIDNIKQFEQLGAGAVVLKSLFEEQIINEISNDSYAGGIGIQYPEALDYIAYYSQDRIMTKYLHLINEAVNVTNIPIIASINCISPNRWIDYAAEIEKAGAHAIELNIFVLPSDPSMSGKENEQMLFDVISAISKIVSIPVSIKISYYFSALAKTVVELSWTGVKGIVMFNRFFSPDIDIENMVVKPSNIFSHPDEINHSLRWVAMLSDRVRCDICASTGVHDGTGAIKQMLAGAKAVQVASTLYIHGVDRVKTINREIDYWMDSKGFKSTSELIGKLSIRNSENPAAYERVQFMKHFAGIEQVD